MKSAVQTISRESFDYKIVQSLCKDVVDENVTIFKEAKWSDYKRLFLKVSKIISFLMTIILISIFGSVTHQVSPSCNEMLITCTYGGLEYDCDEIFNSVLTDDGVCCSFNVLSRKHILKSMYMAESVNVNVNESTSFWAPELGYDSNKNRHPRPAAGLYSSLV